MKSKIKITCVFRDTQGTSIIYLFILLLFYTLSVNAADKLLTKNLRVDYKVNPIGIDTHKPRFSWELATEVPGVSQTAYEILVALNVNDLKSGKNLLWKSGKVSSDQSIHVVYDGKELKSSQKVYWQVRVWDNQKRSSRWSEVAFWEMGLLSAEDWLAQWIEPKTAEDTTISQASPFLRKEFTINKKIKLARLYITSHGLYEAEINGKKVGDQVFTPGWTSYNKRLQYQTYDVTAHLVSGDNAIGVMLGDGWYRGYLGWIDNRNTYGNKLALLLQLSVTYTDGTTSTIISDNKWKASTGPILQSDIYMGETYDARNEFENWSNPGFENSTWKTVEVKDHSKEILIAPFGPPVKKIQEITPINITSTEDGKFIVDMGQNMVGWIRLKVSGNAGNKVILHHAEVLDKKGIFYTDNLRAAKQKIEYILKGSTEEVFEPHFTFQGFRYVEVTGFPGQLKKENLTGIVIHSALKPTGIFECSNPMINQLQQNIIWGQKGNFLDVPTDCPQRDERLGWTGDAQVFASTACFNMDVASFFTKWMKDVSADQFENGSIPDVVPDVLGGGGKTGWADAAIVIPWTVYQSYGDTHILKEQYESMKGWIDYMEERAGEDFVWDGDWHFGDWLAFDASSPAFQGAHTQTDLIATAYFAYSTGLMAKIATILDKKEEAIYFSNLVKKIKSAFQEEYLTPNGRIISDTQTAYVLALAFDLIPDNMKEKTASYLAADVKSFNHITTGFLGTPLINPILSQFGYQDLAYMLLNREKYPSWLYPVRQGATTIWERWDGLKPDSTFQDVGMNSFNHYAYGAIGQWLYSNVAGISLDEERPAYKHIIINPHPGGDLTYAKAELLSMYGKIGSQWEEREGKLTINISIPPNTTASVWYPSADTESVLINGKSVDEINEVNFIEMKNGKAIFNVTSGEYKFEKK